MNSPHAARPMFSAIVERIETRVVDLPAIRPHKLAVAAMRGLVTVFRDDDVTGIGEGTTVARRAYGPERPEAMTRTIDASVAPATG